MKHLIGLSFLLLAAPSFADVTWKTLTTFINSLEGKYQGTYGLLNKKSCAVTVSVEPDRSSLPQQYIKVEIVREDGLIRSSYLRPGHFLALEYGDKIDDYYGGLKLTFTEADEFNSVSIMAKDAFFVFQRIRCRNLTKM